MSLGYHLGADEDTGVAFLQGFQTFRKCAVPGYDIAVDSQ